MSADTPTEPGWYWRRVLHGGDTQDGPGERWAVAEVYRLHGDDDGPLYTNGYAVVGSVVTWGPRAPDPEDMVRLRAEVERLTGQLAQVAEANQLHMKALRASMGAVERLTAERDARPTAKAAGERADRIAAEWRAKLTESQAEAARLRGRVAEVERERDDARIHELHALARVASPGGHGAAEFARILAKKRGWGYLYDDGTPTGATPCKHPMRGWRRRDLGRLLRTDSNTVPAVRQLGRRATPEPDTE